MAVAGAHFLFCSSSAAASAPKDRSLFVLSRCCAMDKDEDYVPYVGLLGSVEENTFFASAAVGFYSPRGGVK
jgi:hypothetical protein